MFRYCSSILCFSNIVYSLLDCSRLLKTSMDIKQMHYKMDPFDECLIELEFCKKTNFKIKNAWQNTKEFQVLIVGTIIVLTVPLYYEEHEFLHGFTFFALFGLHSCCATLIYYSNTYFSIQMCLVIIHCMAYSVWVI